MAEAVDVVVLGGRTRGEEVGRAVGSPGVDRRVLVLLAAVALGAWVALFAGFDGGGAGIIGSVTAWTVMMLPSAAPFVLLYRRGASRGGGMTRV